MVESLGVSDSLENKAPSIERLFFRCIVFRCCCRGEKAASSCNQATGPVLGVSTPLLVNFCCWQRRLYVKREVISQLFKGLRGTLTATTHRETEGRNAEPNDMPLAVQPAAYRSVRKRPSAEGRRSSQLAANLETNVVY